MEKLYDFLQRHKWITWSFLIITFAALTVIGIRCTLEENIFKLLPMPDTEITKLAFSDNRLKDKVFVQVIRKDTSAAARDTIDAAYMAEAMDFFMEKAVEKDSSLHGIYNTLCEIDPLMLMDAATFVLEHGPGYLNLTTEQFDTLTSEEHIRENVHMYMNLMNTDLGGNLYDLLAYDPCGMAISQLPDEYKAKLTAKMSDEGEYEEMEEEEAEPQQSRFQENHLFAGNGEACIAFISPTFGPEDSQTASKLLCIFEDAKAEMEAQYPGCEVLYHGTVIQSGYNSRQIKKDLALTIGIALLVIIIVLFICFKRPSYILLLLLPIAYGVVFSLACIEIGRGWMSLMALGLGAIVLGVALSYCLHVLIHYVYTGDVHLTIREQTKPVLMGSLTTIGAFAGLLFTKSSLLQDFGIFALLVIIGTTFISLVIMPHFFPKKNTPNKWAFGLMEKVNSTNADRSPLVCAIVWVFVLICVCFAGKYEFDSNLRHIGYVPDNVQRAMDNWNRLQNDGNTQQYYACYAPTLDEALDKLPQMEGVVNGLRDAGIVKNKVNMSIALPSLSKQAERNEAWEAYFTPKQQERVWHNIRKACYAEGIDEDFFMPFYELMTQAPEPESLAEAGVLPDEIVGNFVEEQNGTVLVYFPVKTTTENAKVAKDVLTQVPGCMVLDPYYYSTDLVELIHDDFNLIMLISSIFVLVLLLISYKGNIWISLIAFAPMMLSWYTVLGAMAIFHQPFNLINIVVSSFIFGIGVDYSIFMMDGLLKGRENKTMVYHKTAITMSAFVLVVCMFSLLFATHPAIHSIGFASLVGMITTMMLTYTLEPNLYKLYIRGKMARDKRRFRRLRQKRMQEQQNGNNENAK